MPPIIVLRGCRQFSFFSVSCVRKWVTHPANAGQVFGAVVVNTATRAARSVPPCYASDLPDSLALHGAPR